MDIENPPSLPVVHFLKFSKWHLLTEVFFRTNCKVLHKIKRKQFSNLNKCIRNFKYCNFVCCNFKTYHHANMRFDERTRDDQISISTLQYCSDYFHGNKLLEFVYFSCIWKIWRLVKTKFCYRLKFQYAIVFQFD